MSLPAPASREISDRFIRVHMPAGTDHMTAEQADAVIAGLAGWDLVKFYTEGPSIRDWTLVGHNLVVTIIGTPLEVGRFMHAELIHRANQRAARNLVLALEETP